MSLKIGDESWQKKALVVVREYDEERHKVSLEKMEKLCEVGQRGKPSLVTDLMGDPICRIRHFPLHVMLVAEYGEEGEVVGVIRGCVKTVSRGNSIYVKLAYLLGLRVSQQHRRFGIGTKLVKHLEEWCKQKGAKYAYMATDCTNEPSINLFTKKCYYSKFRTLTMLVQPVHAHYKPINSNIAILHIPPSLATSIYNHIFANSEFFPRDIDLILSNKLNLGTFMAIPKKYLPKCDLKKGIYPPSYSILSVWNTKEVFKLQVKGVSPLAHACCVGTRILDEWLPWLRVPSFPDVFRPFGVYFLYGLHMEGKYGRKLMKGLCGFVHNMARDEGGCGVIVAELGQRDPVKEAVPHWRKFSWAEDMWCIKNLEDSREISEKCGPFDWSTSRSSSPVIFVDPRDF
ncbi:PREDICTED: probable N-acetyltransferase HLS1 [Lupinus angustifolius]|uniref:probable N-acetyltransferase HLS1 n=1 Tax=Lupinus angustifolius TaxID=3871 RepID=UPI00092EFB73|nr:PREDICTED: probable N-acetyltransferase HLS1 [Lupinus angustifolius]